MFITNAAIMYQNGDVLEGKSYHKIHALAQKLGLSGEHICGFVDSSGEFVLPREAAIIASNSGQLVSHVVDLSPDDLWAPLQID